MKRIAVLGSTGSVGEQTLDVVGAHPDRYEVVALAAGRRVEKLAEQVRRFRPSVVSVAEPEGVEALRALLGPAAPREIGVGAAGLEAVASTDCELVVAGLVGAVGLAPTLAAVRAGRDVALANKEVLVMAGALVRREVAAAGVTLVPVDSEHSAIFQALAGEDPSAVRKLILTASGGPFRTWSPERIAAATVAEALDHPNWDMGPKITVDSASLMNKGLEVIEARWLFDVPADRVEVVVHPQSIVHSLVEFHDTSVMAQLGLPDMRVPIAVALAHPQRLPLELPSLDLASVSRLDFEAPDTARFPCLGLAFAALEADEAAPAVLNAANEVAVEAFLGGGLSFPEIAATNAAVLEAWSAGGGGGALRDLEDAERADAWARARAQEQLKSRKGSLA